MVYQPNKKTLRQIFGTFRRPPISPNISIERKPVSLAKVLQSSASASGVLPPRSQNHRPMCRRKIMACAFRFLGFAARVGMSLRGYPRQSRIQIRNARLPFTLDGPTQIAFKRGVSRNWISRQNGFASSGYSGVVSYSEADGRANHYD